MPHIFELFKYCAAKMKRDSLANHCSDLNYILLDIICWADSSDLINYLFKIRSVKSQ